MGENKEESKIHMEIASVAARLAEIEREVRLHWDASPDPNHPLVKEYYACGESVSAEQCRDPLRLL